MKPTAEQVLATIFEQVELDKINQQVDAMSDEQIAKELEAEGYTQAKIDKAFEKQQKMLDELLGEEKRERRKQAVIYASGLATAAAVALVVRSTTTTATTTTPTATTASHPPPSRAEELRKEAFDACGRGHWADCERKLDEATSSSQTGRPIPTSERTAIDRTPLPVPALLQLSRHSSRFWESSGRVHFFPRSGRVLTQRH